MRTARISRIAASLKPWPQAASAYELQYASGTAPRQHAPLLRALCRNEEGGALIEAALVLVLYFTLTIAMMSVSVILFAYANTVYASKVAVRYAAVHSSTSADPCTASDIQNIIEPYLWGAPTGGITITPKWSPNNTVGSTFSITVSLDFPTSLPFVNSAGLQTSTTAQGFVLY